MKMHPNSSQTSLQLVLLTDEELVQGCERQAFRGPGPGGQKRNKTSNGIRLVHVPTGVSAEAVEHRSQAQNLGAAVERLRWALATGLRSPAEPTHALLLSHVRQGRFVAPRRAEAVAVAVLVLDVLAEAGFVLKDAADRVGVSTASLSAFLTSHPPLLTVVNTERLQRGLRPLQNTSRNGSRS